MKILGKFFQILGVIFFILILLSIGGGLYLFIVDPFNIKPLLLGNEKVIESDSGVEVDKNPLLSAEQEQQLEAIGIDPAALPSEITPAMEQCAIDTLGQEKATAIAMGQQSPSPLDIFKTKHCLDL